MKRVLVFGDAISDVYSECSYKKECPDAPNVFAYVRHSREVRPGGAANVAANLAMLSPGTQVDLIAVLDVELARSLKTASQSRVDVSRSVFVDEAIRKERFILDGKLSARIDNMAKLDPWHAEFLLDALDAYLLTYKPDLIIISDYAAGALTEKALNAIPRDNLLVDTKESDLSKFAGALLCKLNDHEWKFVVAKDAIPERHVQYLVVTHGSKPSELTIRRHRRFGSLTHTLAAPTYDVETVDVCGCGDTFLAGMAASLLVNDDPFTAMQFANAASATVVTQPRTAVADLTKTLQLLGREDT